MARALVEGDHLLTAAYRLAAQTGSLAFAACFAHAVERTVAGEIEQGRAAGERLDAERYAAIAAAKSGELLGCALAIAPTLAQRPEAADVYRIGQRLGLLYQMLDDLLDYCPATDTGKPPLADYLQRRWTWVLAELPALDFGADGAEVIALLHAERDGAGSAMQRCVERLEREAAAVLHDLRAVAGERPVIERLVGEWLARARAAVAREAAARGSTERVRRAAQTVIRDRLPEPDALAGFFARHSRSFHFAARLFPAAERAQVARIYAYCRVTDDLVDRPGRGAAGGEAVLEEWLRLSRQAYRGEPTGLALLDAVMGEMAAHAIPFAYAAELVEGMRMDLRAARFDTLAALRVYTYRVAAVVGLWLTELAGVREPAVLERAASLGHAMQLTNILRDVGEDWRAGRLYLPAELLDRHGLSEADIGAMHDGVRPIGARYRALLEEVMEIADEEYRRAFAAIPSLPAGFQRPVAVAARVYRGVHAEIRRRGYDNLTVRARTSAATKLVLGLWALWELRSASRIYGAVARPHDPLLHGLRGRAWMRAG